MNNGHKKRGWLHVARGHRKTSDGRRSVSAVRDTDNGYCWRLFVDGLEVGKSKKLVVNRALGSWSKVHGATVTDLTPIDLARLLQFVVKHNGRLPDVPRGVFREYEHLSNAGLVTLSETEERLLTGDVVLYYAADITPAGKRVAEAMAEAGLALVRRQQLQREDEERRARIPKDCLCNGAGWVWRHELPDTSDWDGSIDDTKYDCPECRERERPAT